MLGSAKASRTACQKYTHEKGKQEFNDWSFDLRKLVAKNADVGVSIKGLEETEDEMFEERLSKLQEATGWKVPWLDRQL